MPHPISRRTFLKAGLASAATSVLAGCLPPRAYVNLVPYVRPPEEQLSGVATWYASTCRECPAGCGVIVRVMNGRAVKLEGNPEHPLNQGKLCARGQAGLQMLYHPDRLAGPVQQAQRGTREYKSISWNEGLNLLIQKLGNSGKGVAVWTGTTVSGHVYDLMNRLTSGLGGQPPIVFDLYGGWNGYRAMSDAAQQWQGNRALPAYDLTNADVVLSFGADLLGTGPSSVRYGVDYGKFRQQGSGKRGYLVQFEPRMSITGAKADRWLPIRPGSEAMVAQAIARIIAERKIGPSDRASRAATLAGNVDINGAAVESGVAVDDLVQVATLFGNAARPIAIPGNTPIGAGLLDALNVIQGLNSFAASGAPLPSPQVPLTAVKPLLSSYSEVQAFVERMRAGQVQALMVYGANPAFELPSQINFADAIKKVPFIVSFAPLIDETAVWADLILPDRTYLESWGYEVVSPNFGIPIVGAQQPVVQPVNDARSTGDILLTVAQRIPATAPGLSTYSDEVAFLRDAIGKLPPGATDGSGPDVLWSRFLQHGGWWGTSAPVSSSAAPPAQAPAAVPLVQFQGEESQFPYLLYPYLSPLFGDGRGARLRWLQGTPDPMTTIAWQTWVEMNPVTAQKLGIQATRIDVQFQRAIPVSDIVRIISPFGQIEAPVYVYAAIRPDTIAMPIGQGHTDDGRYARDRGSNPLQLIGTTATPPPSAGSKGELNWATVRVRIEKTGRTVSLATFEFTPGVATGFINAGFPGQ